MRQFTILIVGLILIATWATLVRSLRESASEQQTVSQASSRSAKINPSATSTPPARVPAHSNVRPLANAGGKRSEATNSPIQTAIVSGVDTTLVSTASYLPAIGKLEEITSGSLSVTWPSKVIEHLRSRGPIFVPLEAKLKANGAVKDRHDQDFDLETKPPGTYKVAVVDGQSGFADATSNQIYTLHVAEQRNAHNVRAIATGRDAPSAAAFEMPSEAPEVPIASDGNNITVRLLLARTQSRRSFLIAEGKPGNAKEVVNVVEPSPISVVDPQRLGTQLVSYTMRIAGVDNGDELTIIPFALVGEKPQHGEPLKLKIIDDPGNTNVTVTLSLGDESPQTDTPSKVKSQPTITAEVVKLPENTPTWIRWTVDRTVVKSTNLPAGTTAEQTFTPNLPDGPHTVTATVFAGNVAISEPKEVKLEAAGPLKVLDYGPEDFGTITGIKHVNVRLNRALADSPTLADSVTITKPDGFSSKLTPTRTDGGLSIGVNDLVARGQYTFTLDGSKITDAHGNELTGSDGTPGTNYVFKLGTPATAAEPIARGLPRRSRGEFVEYPPFLPGKEDEAGFNPNDRVETRVARLYFFRDAHRVAQIINRLAESYNRQGVSASQQLASQARREANEATEQRFASEQKAIRAAQETRRLQEELAGIRAGLDTSLRELEQASLRVAQAQSQLARAQSDAERQAAQAVLEQNQRLVQQFETSARLYDQQIGPMQQRIQTAQQTESESNDSMQRLQRKEETARVEQFRLEAALGHTNPDTYAAGNIKSVDPVAQVSVTVIGEGLLHLRGPLRGLNKVRMMIDQLDAPQGQVAVLVHTAQINGDEAEHLEVVANRIQTYIDQARFLTAQSAEMLRKSVQVVASRRAEQTRAIYPGVSQRDRDYRYLDAFFGTDFINELHTADSELLRTGNKLLSLHSMDVTSLSHALLLISLAKNSTRLEILQEFQRRLAEDLPLAEAQYIRNGIGCCTGGCKEGCKHHSAAPPICQLSQNATFTSLFGFFNTQIEHDDTLTPMQREVIKLAQILRARLISEKELKQRINDRSIIESRIAESNDREQMRRDLDAQARRDLQDAMLAHQKAHAALGAELPRVTAGLDGFQRGIKRIEPAVEAISEVLARLIQPGSTGDQSTLEAALGRIEHALATIDQYRANRVNQIRQLKEETRFQGGQWMEITGSRVPGATRALSLAAINMGPESDVDDQVFIVGPYGEGKQVANRINQLADQVQTLASSMTKSLNNQISEQTQSRLANIKEVLRRNEEFITEHVENNPNDPLLQELRTRNVQPLVSISSVEKLMVALREILQSYQTDLDAIEQMKAARNDLIRSFNCLSQNVQHGSVSLEEITALFQSWSLFTNNLSTAYDQTLPTEIEALTKSISETLKTLSTAYSRLVAARSVADHAKQPLDHKKFLDMFIDEEEEQLIELLEGTRAHTANIDNYLHRITSALHDDFNRQFYFPTRQMIRTASQFKRVEFGQVETTGVLSNNREFAKVSPSATMEFDLPKRDILIKEAIDGALATYNDVGALLNDPNFLAMMKMSSGLPAGATAAGNMGVVRNVIPGLETDTVNQVISRHSGESPGFGSNLEKLIPDPAIYKFETGTGYEIRPVIAPDGQAVVFDFQYLYTTQIREPVRADEKHLGRVKRHLIDTDVKLGNFEMREVSRYTVALKAERTARGVPLLEDIPVVGALWRPLPSREKSLQQNIVLAQATIFPTLYDLMGLRWAPEVARLDPLRLAEREFINDNRNQQLKNYIDGITSAYVDNALGIPRDARREDLYYPPSDIPKEHPNGYSGPGRHFRHSQIQEGYTPAANQNNLIPQRSAEGPLNRPARTPLPSFQSLPSVPGAAVGPGSMPTEYGIEQAMPHSMSSTQGYESLPSGRPGMQSQQPVYSEPAIRNPSPSTGRPETVTAEPLKGSVELSLPARGTPIGSSRTRLPGAVLREGSGVRAKQVLPLEFSPEPAGSSGATWQPGRIEK